MQQDHARAIHAARGAVEIACRLVSIDKDAFQLSLGQSLLALGNRLLAASELEPALPIIRETVDVNRLVAGRDQTDQAKLQLVMALDQLGRALSTIGEMAEAIAAVAEAAVLLGDLSLAAPHLRPDYSTLLQTNSMYCLQADRPKEAVQTAEIATSVARLCLATDGVPARVRLAVSLNQLSNAHEAAGEIEEAYIAIEEAVSVTSDLGEHDWPSQMVDYDTFYVGVSTRMWVLFKTLNRKKRNIQRLRRASDAIAECVHICRRAHGRWQDEELQLRLADALSYHAEAMETREKGIYALRAVQEATEVHAALARQDPSEYLASYATSLLRQAELAAKYRLRDPGLTQTCVAVHRQLRNIDPLQTVRLALALSYHSDDLVRRGQNDEALRVNLEAMSLLRTSIPTLDDPKERLVALQTLHQRAALYHKLGHLKEAFAAFSQLERFLELEQSLRPPGFHVGYCQLYLARIQFALGQYNDARDLAGKGLVSFTRALQSGYRRAVMFGIRCVRTQAACLYAIGERWPARFVRRDALRMWRELFPLQPRPSQFVRGIKRRTKYRARSKANFKVKALAPPSSS
ncbi:hypothetical protein AURDEDRAFT_142781 [Auricularia subglabra TFB-10046 SS5]|nr:hypothetical protein AURDEDRAFT_142781 [Auricularia subglabra TFB-10046 SS5]